MPTNPSTVTRKHNDDLKKKWKEEWRASTRGKKALHADKTTPSDKFLKAISKANLSREVASRIVQLRLQHIPLNSYLHRFKRVDKPNCPACGEADETITHFLLSCPSYAFEQWALARQVRKRKKHMTVETLVGDPEMVKPLANYIDSTGRFKNTPKDLGEQSNTQNGTSA